MQKRNNYKILTIVVPGMADLSFFIYHYRHTDQPKKKTLFSRTLPTELPGQVHPLCAHEDIVHACAGSKCLAVPEISKCCIM